MAKKFRDALLGALKETGIPLRQVAEGAGVSYEQLKKLNQGRSGSTNVDDAVLVANFFGKSLDEFLGDETAVVRSEVLALYNMLTPQERQFLLSSARGLVGARGFEMTRSLLEGLADQ